MKTFSPKIPSEIIPLSISFKRMRRPGETATSATVRAVDIQTGEEVAGVLDTAAPDISEWPIVIHRAIGGVDGETYIIEATVTTSNGRRIVGQAKLPVCSRP